MSFLRSFWRQKKVRQTEMVEVQFSVNGTTLAVTGPDKAFIKSVEALDVGEYLITIVEDAFYDLHPFYVNVDGEGVAHVSAVSRSSIVVETVDLAGAPDDLNFSVGLIWLYTNYIR
jgi:hypothetical protein